MPGSWSDFLKLRSGPAPPPSSEAGAVRVYADTDGALRSVQSDGTDAPIGGGVAFNGGTITTELVVDTGSGTGQALELQGSRTSEHDIFRIDYPHTIVSIDSDGVATFSSDDTMGVSVLGTNNTSANLSIATDNANRSTVQFSTSFGVRVTQNGTSTSTLRVNDNTGARVFEAGLLGVVVAVHSAPADGSLAAGDCAIWFDQTNGAAKLMVKAKQADGTVVAAAIALS